MSGRNLKGIAHDTVVMGEEENRLAESDVAVLREENSKMSNSLKLENEALSQNLL
jgi:hypothetical protein